jgi:hypothetical protein
MYNFETSHRFISNFLQFFCDAAISSYAKIINADELEKMDYKSDSQIIKSFKKINNRKKLWPLLKI